MGIEIFNASLSSVEGHLNDPQFVLHADMPLRHQVVASVLGIELPDDIQTWYDRSSLQLREIIEERFDHPVTMFDASETRFALNAAVSGFREEAYSLGRRPMVVALDPMFIDHSYVDYFFQETRVSITPDPYKPIIDLEHNPRSFTNRFMRTSSPENGAGQALESQVAEVHRLADGSPGTSIAIIEDYTNSGRGILNRFASFVGDEETELRIIAGFMNVPAAKRFADAGIAYEAAYRFIEMPAKYMDQTDLLPTLGGRVVGQTVRDGETACRTSLQVVRQLGADAVMAVDAITGNYPWQVDLYTRDMTPDFRKKLYAYSLETAHAFWDSLERGHNAELTWTDLRALNGIARVFYPMRDLSLAEVPDHLLARGPRHAVEIIGEVYGA